MTTIKASAKFEPRPTAELNSMDLDRRSAFALASGRTRYTTDISAVGMAHRAGAASAGTWGQTGQRGREP